MPEVTKPIQIYMKTLLLLLLCLIGQATIAETITVTNGNDSGPGSLRNALEQAQSGDVIIFSDVREVMLTSGYLTINKNVTIKGNGVTIRGAFSPIMQVASNATVRWEKLHFDIPVTSFDKLSFPTSGKVIFEGCTGQWEIQNTALTSNAAATLEGEGEQELLGEGEYSTLRFLLPCDTFDGCDNTGDDGDGGTTTCTVPSITGQPTSAAIIYGNDVVFTVEGTGNVSSFQWEEFNNGIWTSLSNGGVYSGVTTDRLTLSKPPVALSGRSYRVKITGCETTVESNGAGLTVNKANQVIAWANPANITFGTALGPNQLNATLTIGDGALTYTPAAGAILNVGQSTLRVDAAGTANFNGAFKEVIITVEENPNNSLPSLPTTLTTGTPGFQDYVIPAGITSITLDVQGAKGGDFLFRQFGSLDDFSPVSVGGLGARISARFPVDPGCVQALKEGGVLRLIVGQTPSGINLTDNLPLNFFPKPLNLGQGGGGGSAILYQAPGSTEWEVLVVSGGGGGAATVWNGQFATRINGFPGIPETNGANTNGRRGIYIEDEETTVFAGGGGGGILSDALGGCGGGKGLDEGADGGVALVCDGGNLGGAGFGAGGSGFNGGGGGGGGYSGGNGGVTNFGGYGAGSFTNTIAERVSFQSGSDTNNGLIYITTSTATSEELGTISRPEKECAGSTDNIYSIAPVNDATSYEWTVTGEGWAVIAGGSTTSATITIGSGVGTVSVRATSACGSIATSTTGEITPSVAPTITRQPSASTITYGQNASFSVEAIPGGPLPDEFEITDEGIIFNIDAIRRRALSYQWEVDSNNDGSFDPITLTGIYEDTDNNPATLEITRPEVSMNGYQYRVIVNGFCLSATSSTATLTVNKADQLITWANPANIIFGTALGDEQLNATLTIGDGALTYTPGAGTILNAGQSTLRVDAAETANYNAASKEVSIIVEAPISITKQPVDLEITYGDNLSFSVEASGTGLTYRWQIDANDGNGFVDLEDENGTGYLGSKTANLSFSAATPVAFNGLKYRVIVTNSSGQRVISDVASLTVNKADQAITWENPADITYGTLLSSTQLNATVAGVSTAGATAPGALTYTPAAGTLLNAGPSQTLRVDAAETDNYNSASKTVQINVLKADQTIIWENPADITYGTLLSSVQLNATVAGVSTAGATAPGALTYTPAAGTLMNAGPSQILRVDAAATDNYNSASKTVQINVLKADQAITWENPADIIYGTLLSSTQLNATVAGVSTAGATAPGALTYIPAAGTLLNAGSSQNLEVEAAETDNYKGAIKTVQINVNKAPLTITANNETRFAGQENPPFSVIMDGFVGDETEDVLDGMLIFTTVADVNSCAGQYDIIPSGLTALNYEIEFEKGILSVEEVSIDASASSAPVQFGDDAILSAKVSPAVEGVMVSFYLDDVLFGSSETGEDGTATLTVSGLSLDVYKVTALIGNGCSESIAYLPVFDPNGNFVTGGGWINSPEGALVGTTTVGKANFGFVSKYRKGSNKVDGNTEFQFNAGNLSFKSTLHEAGTLVISGKKATYRGDGTVNGVSGYRFTITAIDGHWNGGTGPDQFRIKIWGINGVVLYDNGLGADENAEDATILGGGSIVIHEVKAKRSQRVSAELITVDWNTPLETIKKKLESQSLTWFEGRALPLTMDPGNYDPLTPGFYELKADLADNEFFELDEPISLQVLVLDKPKALDIELSNQKVVKSATRGMLIGTLNTIDPVDNIHSYSLAENENVELNGDQLIWIGSSVPTVFFVQVMSTDRAGQTISKEIQLSRELGPNEFILYPNPAQNETNIWVELDQGAHVEIVLFDAIGRIVIQDSIYREKTFTQRINLDGLAPGMYMVQVKIGDIVMTERLIKR